MYKLLGICNGDVSYVGLCCVILGLNGLAMFDYFGYGWIYLSMFEVFDALKPAELTISTFMGVFLKENLTLLFMIFFNIEYIGQGCPVSSDIRWFFSEQVVSQPKPPPQG